MASNTFLILFLLVGFVITTSLVAYNMIIERMTALLIIRSTINKQSYVQKYNCLIQKKIDGSVWWKSFPFPKLKVPAPPDEVIDIGEHGRKIAEGYQISTDEIIWIKDEGYKNEKGLTILRNLQPFTATQRSTLVSEYEIAYAKKGKSWLTPEIIMPLATLSILGLIIFGIFVFYGDLVTPLVKMGEQNIKFQQENARIAEMFNEKCAGIQSFTVPPNSDVPLNLTPTEKPT